MAKYACGGDEPCGWRPKKTLPSPWHDAASSRRSHPRREEDAKAIRCHVKQCERCYPMFNWERLFLDLLKERGDRPEPSDELRQRVTELVDHEPV